MDESTRLLQPEHGSLSRLFFRCTWCSKPIWGNHYLQRSPLEVAAEMAHLKRTFSPDHIWFADDIFGFRVDWVAQFAAATQKAGAQIPFTYRPERIWSVSAWRWHCAMRVVRKRGSAPRAAAKRFWMP